MITLINKQITTFEATHDTAALLDSICAVQTSPKRTTAKRSSHLFQKLVSDKINDGDIRGAVRIVVSEDSLAPYSYEVLSELLQKQNRRIVVLDLSGCNSIVIAVNKVARAIKSFLMGSSGGITRLRPQHLKEAFRSDAGDQRRRLLHNLPSLINVIVSNRLPAYLAPVLCGANVTALNKKIGDVRPIAV